MELTKRQARYINRLMPFQITIEYKKSKENIADALSRHAIQQLASSSLTDNQEWLPASLQDPEWSKIFQRPERVQEPGVQRQR
mmetsp:Transcript_13106/g.52198  ORF Transcript_13106/g.52198 Transcript_13106/m.52198 type:complete len:83 (-) Transcript_13106:847-1095(-)